MPVPTALQRLPRASWKGTGGGTKIEFPVRHVTVKGSMRHHVHEYPHSPGGAFEGLARRLYEIRMTCSFMETFKAYPNLWPLNLDTLRSSFERGDIGELTIPTIGTIQAHCINWTQSMDARVQSGEEVEFEFLEDISDLFLADIIIGQGTISIGDAANGFDVEVQKSGLQETIFDQIRDVSNVVLSYFDQGEAFSNLLAAKIEGLVAIITEADHDVLSLQDPRNFAVLNAMRDLYTSSVKLFQDILQQKGEIQLYIVPMLMPIGDVSTAIYGDATHGVELLQLNPIDDAFAIPAATRIRYYPSAA